MKKRNNKDNGIINDKTNYYNINCYSQFNVTQIKMFRCQEKMSRINDINSSGLVLQWPNYFEVNWTAFPVVNNSMSKYESAPNARQA